MAKIKPLLNKYNWEGISFPSENDWKNFEKNNQTIVLNVLYAKKEKIYLAYVSKHRMKKDEEGWNYLAVKKLSALLRGITSKHHGDFYYLNCLHSFATENKRESHQKVSENIDFCNVVMPSEDTGILEFS